MNYISPWIMTTMRCNCACGYCFLKQESSDMSEKVYQQIQNVTNHLLDTKQVDHIVFRIAGGEPLLCFDKWKKIFATIKKEHPKQVSLALLTNLTLLTEEMLDWFVANDVGFGVSLDSLGYGKPFKDGTSSSRLVANNIEKLILKRGNESLDISTVICSTNLTQIPKLARFIAGNNLSWGITLDHYFCGEIDKNILKDLLFKTIDELDKYNYNRHYVHSIGLL